jgi:predicted ATPase
MLIERLRLQNILSFRDTTVKLGQLNVLIGPNGVGKSNLIEVIALLQAAPTNLATAILRAGGIRQLLWLGDDLPLTATIDCDFRLQSGSHAGSLPYRLQVTGNQNGHYAVSEESLGDYFMRSTGGDATVRAQGLKKPATQMKVGLNESLLSQFKNPADPTPITAVGRALTEIQIFREFRTGSGAPMRYGISTNAPKNGLQEGGDNLAMVLQDLNVQDQHERVNTYLKRFCDRFTGAKVEISDGMARILLNEAGLREKVASSRISDGTLKFLGLLAVLFSTKKPPLICLEEPELGLHPDALQLIAELLLEASESTQLVVTTHSEALVDALTGHPESVLVCERDFDNSTQMNRLSKKKLKVWLERYSLGELWRKGEIGGGRW